MHRLLFGQNTGQYALLLTLFFLQIYPYITGNVYNNLFYFPSEMDLGKEAKTEANTEYVSKPEPGAKASVSTN